VKICSIRNEYLKQDDLIGYLFYYEKDRSFCIELDERRAPSDMALLLGAFAEKKQYTLDPDWSRRWVEQRIVPTDRQNLGAILREAGLKEYDRYRLLVLSGGRCSQDDLAIAPVREDQLEEWALERLQRRIDALIPLPGYRLFVMLRNGTAWIAELQGWIQSDERRNGSFTEGIGVPRG